MALVWGGRRRKVVARRSDCSMGGGEIRRRTVRMDSGVEGGLMVCRDVDGAII